MSCRIDRSKANGRAFVVDVAVRLTTTVSYIQNKAPGRLSDERRPPSSKSNNYLKLVQRKSPSAFKFPVRNRNSADFALMLKLRAAKAVTVFAVDNKNTLGVHGGGQIPPSIPLVTDIRAWTSDESTCAAAAFIHERSPLEHVDHLLWNCSSK